MASPTGIRILYFWLRKTVVRNDKSQPAGRDGKSVSESCWVSYQGLAMDCVRYLRVPDFAEPAPLPGSAVAVQEEATPCPVPIIDVRTSYRY